MFKFGLRGLVYAEIIITLIFWLLHCNVDRIYEAYVKKEGLREIMREFRANQRNTV